MQTFLPYANFKKSAEVLDRMRLGKQRVETYQILKVLLTETKSNAWKNHPAVKMWKGYEMALLHYQAAICKEWTSRGYRDTCLEKSTNVCHENRFSDMLKSSVEMPWWLGIPEFHASHRSNLLRKKPEYYSQFGWVESDDLDYVWPSKEFTFSTT